MLYLGHDKRNLLQVYSIPPDRANQDWALPYSTRSFVNQASRTQGGCLYVPARRGEVMDETVFSDYCHEPDVLYYEDTPRPRCHMLSGWSMFAKNDGEIIIFIPLN